MIRLLQASLTATALVLLPHGISAQPRCAAGHAANSDCVNEALAFVAIQAAVIFSQPKISLTAYPVLPSADRLYRYPNQFEPKPACADPRRTGPIPGWRRRRWRRRWRRRRRRRRLIADATSQLSNCVQQERRLTPAGRPFSSALSSSRSHDRQDPWPVRQANQLRRMNRLSAADHSRDRSEWERRRSYHLCCRCRRPDL